MPWTPFRPKHHPRSPLQPAVFNCRHWRILIVADHNPQQFIEFAVKLSGELPRLPALRAKLRQPMRHHPKDFKNLLIASEINRRRASRKSSYRSGCHKA